jgi:hypothetical protein
VITCVAFDSDWFVAAAPEAPPAARPVRVTVAEVIEGIVEGIADETGGEPRHRSMATATFADAAQLDAYLGWSGLEPPAEVIVARDHVMRGADWLEQRSQRGGRVLKHVALAKRADGLTLGQMLEGWAGHGGAVQGPGEQAVAIPAEIRGLAYVQHRPLVERGHEWPYDAITEVFFDDVDALRARATWFASGPGAAPQALFRQSWFLALREDQRLPRLLH